MRKLISTEAKGIKSSSCDKYSKFIQNEIFDAHVCLCVCTRENQYLFRFRWFVLQVLDIVRAAESLALGTHVSDSNASAELVVSHPPKSPVEHEDKMQKTTTIVMSAHTLDTQPQVCAAHFSSFSNSNLFFFSN